MQVLFDAFWWVNGPVSNQQVLHEIVHAWRQEFPEDRMILAVRKRDEDTVRAALGIEFEIVTTRLAPQGISAIAELPFLARRTKADIVISHNFTPFFGRSVVFIHDVLFVTNPEWFTKKELAYFRLMTLSAPRANKVVTSTRSEAARIEASIRGVGRAHPVGLAVGNRLALAQTVRPSGLPAGLPFLLTVGRLNVRKNLAFTCEAAINSGRISRDFPLVIAGGYQGKTTTFPPSVQLGIEAGQIILLGHVSVAELAWLYSNAAVFVFMAKDEGFGLPPLEALSFGTAVIASDIAVMREVAGADTTFVSPDDPRGLMEALEHVQLGRPREGTESRVEYARKQYSWAAVATGIRQQAVEAQSQRPKRAGA